MKLTDVVYILIVATYVVVVICILFTPWWKKRGARKFFCKCEKGTLLAIEKNIEFWCGCDVHYMIFDTMCRECVDLKYICSENNGVLHQCIFANFHGTFSMTYEHFKRGKVVDEETKAKVIEWYMKKRR